MNARSIWIVMLAVQFLVLFAFGATLVGAILMLPTACGAAVLKEQKIAAECHAAPKAPGLSKFIISPSGIYQPN